MAWILRVLERLGIRRRYVFWRDRGGEIRYDRVLRDDGDELLLDTGVIKTVIKAWRVMDPKDVCLAHNQLLWEDIRRRGGIA